MRLTFGIIMAAIIGMAVCGCQGPMQGVDVLIEGGEGFPDFLVGKWVDKKTGWEFVFRPDGRISNAVYAMGLVDIVPGKVSRFPTKFGGKGVFEPGVWTVTYSHDIRELAVTVVMDHFIQDVGGHAIEGFSVVDYLAGPISEDGLRWDADLLSSGKMEALISEGDKINRKLLFNNEEPVDRGKVIFEKVVE